MKKDIYQSVTNNIIEALEKVSLEDYKAPFANLTAQQLPINSMTENNYHGINTLILWLEQQVQSFGCNEWGTFSSGKTKVRTSKKVRKAL